ncbi:MAG: glucosamine-6-phosphate deaminase [Streptococcaceae bacterium]|jgi:glucosamine-6-phosphate deaminase|nr:glucosamine-6-phosphate deaminase [Streptococcaceae bacterium]
MQVFKVADQAEGGQKAYELLREAINGGAKTFGLATGSTPVTFYENVVNSDLDFSDKTSINLDEYVGLDGANDQSYRYFMNEHLFNFKPFKENFLPNGKASNLDEEVKRYDGVIDAHPIDFQILGIGGNGHIGFNEPGTSFDVTTHVVDLAPETIAANARFFENESDVPRQAISMGIASILKSKQIVLLAFGKAKAEAVKGMLEGPVTTDCPASVLQNHANVTVIADKEAASLIK